MCMSTLASLTVKELLKVAAEKNVRGRTAMKKTELIAAIETADAVVAEAENEVEEELKQQIEMYIEYENTETLDTIICASNEEWEKEAAFEKKPKADYINKATVGVIVAFKVVDKTISGMVEEVLSNEFVVKTKNGIKFTVRKKNVVWVKTGLRWPRFIYEALKGVTESATKVRRISNGSF